MSALAPLTAGRLLGDWRFDPWAAVTVAVLLAAYLAGVRRVRRTGRVWPTWRVVGFVGLGLGSLVVATMSSLVVYSSVLLWPAALQVTVLLTLVPVGLGLGDPLSLVTACLPPAGARRWRRGLASRPFRVLTFPLVAPVLAVATQFVVFYTGYLGSAQRSGTVLHLLELQLVVTGCLFALPLLGVDVLPAWCTQPVRMAAAAIDGLLDAIPGIAVMTSSSLVAAGYYGTVTRSWGPTRSWDQAIGGGLMLTVAEVVAVPFAAIVYRAWIREDAAHAAAVDRRLDEQEILADVERQLDPGLQSAQIVMDRPWWETETGTIPERVSRHRGGGSTSADLDNG